MTYTTLLVEAGTDGIVTATINRPDKLNALNAQVIADLGCLVEDVERTPSMRALILTGAGPKAFVAGADIGEIAEVDGAEGKRLAQRGQGVFRAIERLRKPVIAAVNGFALGGGCELAMACHIRYASPTARFGQPEVKLGILPGYGGTVRLPRLVGLSHALDLILTGRGVSGEEAVRMGLANRLVEPGCALAEARELAAGLARFPEHCLRSDRLSAYEQAGLDLPRALANETRLGMQVIASGETRAGAGRFAGGAGRHGRFE